MTTRSAKNAGAVFSLQYHIVWCPKYRRPVLTPPIDGRLKDVLGEVASEYDMTFHTIDIMPDHVHVFVEADPTLGVAEIVNRLKGKSSRVLRQEFPALRSRLPTLWSRSYFAATVGSVSEETIRRYIEDQKGK
ncbi:transposase [Azospirillum sp. TSH7]|uniref:IS200/IS605 family transposase n=1 Tax=unclassified Azospirillum TaxID=2630922 RepID=UPI000D612661|nr:MULTISPECIES: IS200/IS605 family transposase [unclassified Azospirillum]PWC61026.1 transposase [Azospirillum sp. TSH7]PWC62837.1 transposase [Azospirillum sp. TSH20]